MLFKVTVLKRGAAPVDAMSNCVGEYLKAL